MAKLVASVIVPVFNTDVSLLSDCLDACISCSEKVELVVVDDGSTASATLDYLSRAPAENARIRVIRRVNGGVAAARNEGLRAARGDWILFVDPDDLPLLAIGQVIDRLASFREDLVFTGAIGTGADGSAVERYGFASYGALAGSDELLRDLLGVYRSGRISTGFLVGVCWAKFFRREHLVSINALFDELIPKRSDSDWMIRVLLASEEVRIVDVPTLQYRLDVPNSLSKAYSPAIMSGFLRIMTTLASIQSLPDDFLHLYRLELVKDAINTVFTSVDAPRGTLGRSTYANFRRACPIPRGLMVKGTLAGASLPRKLLYVGVSRQWYVLIVAIRSAKSVLRAIGRLRGC